MEQEPGKWAHLVRIEPTGEITDLGAPEYELQVYNPESWDINDGWYPIARGILLILDLHACAICELLDQVEEQTRKGS